MRQNYPLIIFFPSDMSKASDQLQISFHIRNPKDNNPEPRT